METLFDQLIEFMRSLESVAVGFSGGADSSVVAAAAARALGPEKVLAVTADSETMPRRELQEARALAAGLGVPHAVIETRELDSEDFSANPADRCFYCKSELWHRIGVLAEERGLANLADGVNADDLGDHRPGIQASDEAGVVHPLASIGAGKQDVRQLALALGLSNWDKPAQACLSSRFPYGEKITAGGLKRVELAEEFLRSLGLGQLRVRSHGDIARIEVPVESFEDISTKSMRREIVRRLKEIGFRYVTLDMEGFRSGSMNEVLFKMPQRE